MEPRLGTAFFRSADKWFSVEPAYYKNSDEFTSIRKQLAAHLKIPNEQRLLSERRLEGGNITSNGKGTCLVGEGGAATRSGAAREGVDTFLIPTGCQKAVWLPAINDPEIRIAGTNHIDMWMKLVSEKQAAVAEIDPKLLEDYRSETKTNQNKYVKAYSNTRELSDLASAKRQLDALIEYTQGTRQDGASRLTKAGFEVFRVPVFALNRLNASLNGIQSGRRMILSTSFPSNGSLGSQNPKLWYEFQARAKQIFASQGFRVDAVVDASLFPQESGAFQCTSAHLPWDVVKHLFEQD